MSGPHTWLRLESGPAAAAFNMALDEALLEAMPRLRTPVVRFYGWTRPAATFGYFQKYSDAARATPLRPLVRRPTGGGVVPHDADWTYSLAFPSAHEWHSLKAVESYRRVHEWIRRAFAELKVGAELASAGGKSAAGQCFAGHERFDVLWRGKKIAGAAQRRSRHGLLIQGSVQAQSLPVSRADWEKALMAALPTEHGAISEPFEADAPLLDHANQLVVRKYSQAGYNQKR